jgi:hypothetical protein
VAPVHDDGRRNDVAMVVGMYRAGAEANQFASDSLVLIVLSSAQRL